MSVYVIKPSGQHCALPFNGMGIMPMVCRVIDCGCFKVLHAGGCVAYADEEGVFKKESQQNILAESVLIYLGNSLGQFPYGIVHGSVAFLGFNGSPLTFDQETAFNKLCTWYSHNEPGDGDDDIDWAQCLLD